MTILITGARGKVGRAVLDRLHTAGHAVRAASKNPADLRVPADVEAVELVLNDPGTFESALRGVSQVFLYPEPEGIDEFLRTAEAAGVKHIVLLSSSAVLSPDAENNGLARPSVLVERALAASNLTATVLRPDAFAANALAWSHVIRRKLPVQLAYPEASVAPIHSDDIADIAVEAFTGDTLTGQTVVLTGAQSLTFREQLAIISGLLGRDITVEHITRAEAERQLVQHVPVEVATSLLDYWAVAADGPAPVADTTDTTDTLLGVPARTFEQWARENLAAF
ncbi:NAD(P)H-binding protein [Nonomuraea sp. NPDC049152]|uniref:SDR family oxidoreductase n=1 Tax=Nonomuraea sp. NPDC049152 TaxID=3154350 RepID=UPI0033C8BA24